MGLEWRGDTLEKEKKSLAERAFGSAISIGRHNLLKRRENQQEATFPWEIKKNNKKRRTARSLFDEESRQSLSKRRMSSSEPRIRMEGIGKKFQIPRIPARGEERR